MWLHLPNHLSDQCGLLSWKTPSGRQYVPAASVAIQPASNPSLPPRNLHTHITTTGLHALTSTRNVTSEQCMKCSRIWAVGSKSNGYDLLLQKLGTVLQIQISVAVFRSNDYKNRFMAPSIVTLPLNVRGFGSHNYIILVKAFPARIMHVQ